MRILFLLFFINSSFLFSQKNELSIEQKKKISLLSKELTGEWKFLGFYYKNKFIGEKTNSYNDFKIVNNIENNIFIHLTPKGYLIKKVNDRGEELYSTLSEIGNLELTFDRQGKGVWLEKEIIPSDNDSIEVDYFEPHSPNLDIQLIKRKKALLFTDMYSQNLRFFKLRKGILTIFDKDRKYSKKYLKIKSNN